MKGKNPIIIIIVVIALLGGAYWYFFAGPGGGNAPTLTAAGTTQSAAQAQFESLLAELQPISFNVDIFSDARFMSLVDISVQTSPETLGRTDPFAPVPGITAASSQQ